MAQVVGQDPQTVGYIPERSYLWHFIQQKEIKIQIVESANGQKVPHIIAVPSWVRSRNMQLYKVGLDLGNNGPKAAMFDSNGRIVVNHMQAVVKAVQDLAAGEMGTTYEELILQPKPKPQDENTAVDTAENESVLTAIKNKLTGQKEEYEEISPGKIWIDQQAVDNDGVSLSKGTTRARLSDPRYAQFLMFTIANLFEKAGYPSGDYDVLVAPGMPNEEMVETATGSQLDEETQKALSSALCTKRWRIRITDPYGRSKQFNFKVADLAPGPQSYAGFYAWQFRPDGQPAQTIINEILLADLGANDLHELGIRLKFQEKVINGEKRYDVAVSATRERKGNGIILAIMQPFAKRLKRQYGLEELDDAIAQQAFFKREITVGGFREDVSALVEAVKAEEGAKVITDVFKGPARPRSFYMLEGGGNVLLREDLVEKLKSLRRTPKTYLLMGAQHASPLNAVGLLAILDQMCRYGQ
ncbi:hypothetical protein KDA_75360 [Dictyobacter alpinus]|uniref:Actin-like protein N-terminal domain-containing protein n=1 Tax=Dictyobacter alpinus TaxID=2014873 RepID=A0A402BL42_9CHLR|nr:hypothetical protein [Dictyobacter alpinus]GCE32052.1 hypothetical protein KDA_75360 [Dictyobacter alpinus]